MDKLDKLFLTFLTVVILTMFTIAMTILTIGIQREGMVRKAHAQCIEEGYKEYICVSIIEGRHIVNAFQNGGKK